MAVMERACDFFFKHAAQLSGIPLRMADRGRRQFPLKSARDAAEEHLAGLLQAKQILPAQVLIRVLRGVLSHISEKIVGVFLADSVKRFNGNAVGGFDVDIRLFESFADNQAHLFAEAESDASQLKQSLAEARQLINLLMSNHPDNYLNAVIREKSYSALDYRKVVAISEKFRDSSDRLFGTFGTRGLKQNPKKKSLDTLIKRLKDVS
ncbi:exocyst complex component SEC15B-like protein [Cinnamomum micranthum f. kanehirae]|uniref:Exocyst complex component SEC15B-like protein n=1 Tax=Cinnamomum micranthum f. kanehirae TaxID=337451 RepID=A0A443PTV7_9MAGN|nr:exocyst complex component SEC15B-like protein [Cinnamomum micranthum f. kanehirae]